jgi:phosphoribosylglycinamide formyltransferase-1
VVSDKTGALGLERAKVAGVNTAVISPKNPAALLERAAGAGLMVLAGYLPILPPEVTDAFYEKIINIHPSLIPSFCGKGYYGVKVHEAALNAGVKITGATVHFVDGGIDSGAILIQKAVNVEKDDTPQTLQKRVLAVEHEILVKAVKAFTEGRVVISGGRARID